MAKRFTATEKWSDPWFCSLTKDEKLFWIYLFENCNHAGIWAVNWSLVHYHFGGELMWDQKKFETRIVPFADGTKWFIPKFIAFQYHGDLHPDNKVHQSVITVLKREGLWPLSRKEEKKPLSVPQPPDPAPTHPRVGPEAKEREEEKATAKALELDKDREKEKDSFALSKPQPMTCEYCGPILNHANHKKCHYCFKIYALGENDDNHRCP